MTTQPPAKLLALKAKVEALSPADQLRLGAALVDAGDYGVAEVIVRNIADELAALRLLRS